MSLSAIWKRRVGTQPKDTELHIVVTSFSTWRGHDVIDDVVGHWRLCNVVRSRDKDDDLSGNWRISSLSYINLGTTTCWRCLDLIRKRNRKLLVLVGQP